MSKSTGAVVLDPRWLRESAARLIEATGLPEPAARTVAASLVDADLRGVPSHGVMLLPMYIGRLRAGSVSFATEAEVVVDLGAVAVLDGQHALGQLTGDQAMGLAVAKAQEFGVGAVAVRRAFHFGSAFRYVAQAAEKGCIGLAAANTRPLMPAWGGAEAVVGNNPIAFAVPRPGGEPLILDMALSAAALGKIRLAAASGQPIPDTWATDVIGRPTTDAAQALEGMLLPMAGPKGFGLALVVDVLTGVLSGGAFGRGVQGLYADLSRPNDSAQFFLAIDVHAFSGTAEFGERVEELCRQVSGSARAPGVDRVYLPGQLEEERAAEATRTGLRVQWSTLSDLKRLAAELGVELTLPPSAQEVDA
ncbi:Ldh family oxidoreductase [Actinomadura sp. 3N407]|uniref:Ldh family oxidoreductase n=1 Tax=Actinomadura sp. 3N407 TaxID=3457423 RepID=UPI003FCE633F